MDWVSAKRNHLIVKALFLVLLITQVPAPIVAAVPDDTVSIGVVNSITTLNPFSIKATTLNQELRSLTTMDFNYWNDQYQSMENRNFGSYSVEATSPLRVRFTVRNGARWSDGTPINAVDLLFSHLISSSTFAKSAQ